MIRIRREDPDFFTLEFPASDHEVDVGHRIVVSPWLLEGVSLSDLRDAAIRLRSRYEHWSGHPYWATDDDGSQFLVCDAAPDDLWGIDEDFPLFLEAELLAGRSGVRARVHADITVDTPADRVRELAISAAARGRAQIVGIELEWQNSVREAWAIDVQLARRAAPVERLLTVAKNVATAVSELAGGADPDAVISVIEAGYPAGLVGTKESDWLEAKGRPWDLDADFGKFELAKDVASFANARGGLIVVGAATRKEDGGETIVRADGVRPELFSPRRIRAVIDHRVHPVIEGLQVGRASIKDSALSVGYIHVPAQDPAAQPFIVHGSITGRKVDGSFVSIVRRRGDQTVSVGSGEIHVWLSLGRRLVREDRVP